MKDGFTVRRVKSEKDLAAVFKLVRMVFPEDSDLFTAYMKCYADGDFSNSLMGIVSGRLVAHAVVIPRRFMIDGVPVEMGQVGYIATHPKYRKQGFMKDLMPAIDTLIAQKGLPLAYLFGIPYFYRRYGYEYALPDDSFRVAPSLELDRLRPGPTVSPDEFIIRRLEFDDIDRALAIYGKDASHRTMWHPRSRKVWSFQSEQLQLFSEGWEAEEVVFEKDGKVKGYMRYDVLDDALKVREVNFDEEYQKEGLSFALEHIINDAFARNLPRVQAAIPLDHPFMNFFVTRGGVSVDYTYGGMMKVIDLMELMKRLKNLINQRMIGTELTRFVGTMTINIYEEHINIRIINGKIRTLDIKPREPEVMKEIRLSPQQFVQLLTGYKGVDDLLGIPDFRIEPRWIGPMKALFPKGNPYIYMHDR